MKEKLRYLQQESSILDSEPEQRDELQNLAASYASRFYNSQQNAKAYRAFDESINRFLEVPLTEGGHPADDTIQQIESIVVSPGLNTVSGRHFGYIPGGGLFASAVGDFLAAVTNRYAGVYASSPGAVLLETRLVNWLCKLIGYGDGSGGYLSSGGGHANLTAVVAARDHADFKAKDFSKAVVYITEQTHHCVDRALNIAGLRECIRRTVPVDDTFRMIPANLGDLIKADREKGLNPWLVVASAGSTDTGAVDPLDRIGTIAKREDLWYHVDAAYGGFFILTEDGKEKLRGIEQADSVVMDPHKGLFLPYGTGALLVKDVKKLADSYRFQANYMRDTRNQSKIYSPAEISPELSKHFRGLRMWLPLKLYGIRKFRKALEEKQLLAQYLWQQLDDMELIEVGPQPQFSIFIFRWVPRSGNVNELNKKLHQAILNEGKIFLSSTEIAGEFYFRVAVLSFRTHIEEADEFLSVLKTQMKQVERDLFYSNPS